jgi:hypothetical protein
MENYHVFITPQMRAREADAQVPDTIKKPRIPFPRRYPFQMGGFASEWAVIYLESRAKTGRAI